MKRSLDECLHPQVAQLLVEAGHDVVTVAALGMVTGERTVRLRELPPS